MRLELVSNQQHSSTGVGLRWTGCNNVTRAAECLGSSFCGAHVSYAAKRFEVTTWEISFAQRKNPEQGSLAQSQEKVGSQVRISRPLADPDNDELGRSKRRNADFNNQPAVVDVILCHRSLIATDEERFVRPGTL